MGLKTLKVIYSLCRTSSINSAVIRILSLAYCYFIISDIKEKFEKSYKNGFLYVDIEIE